MAFVHHRTKGFVFKKTARFEADTLFTIFSYDFGRIEVVGRAIRKIRSKLKAGAELFYLSEIEFIQGKSYKILTDVLALEKFKNIRKNIGKLKVAYQIAETLDNLIKGQEPDKQIFNLLNESFAKLNICQLSIVNCQLLFHYFLWNFFSILGYQPELFKCLVCQNPVDLGNYFSAKDGGIVCSICANRQKGRQKEIREINSDVVKILRIILKKDWQTLSRLKIEQGTQKSLKDISEDYYSNLLREQQQSDII